MESPEQTSEEVAGLVEREVNATMNESPKSALLDVLVPPRLQMRRWDYSLTHELLPCWIVAEFRGTPLGLAYTSQGHGRRGDCWGVVELAGESFGRDDSWFVTLEDALINSGQYHGPVPEDYEIR
jgi:hypothetical protein